MQVLGYFGEFMVRSRVVAGAFRFTFCRFLQAAYSIEINENRLAMEPMVADAPARNVTR
jgi:hypothetical protein